MTAKGTASLPRTQEGQRGGRRGGEPSGEELPRLPSRDLPSVCDSKGYIAGYRREPSSTVYVLGYSHALMMW